MLNIENEIWKPVPEFKNLYKISSYGRVASHRKLLSTHIINSGYEVVTFKVNGKSIKRLVHRLVAQAFIENPENKKTVNHIDGDKLNNTLANLEWATYSENKIHSFEEGFTEYNIPTKGLKLGKASKYHNVSYDKHRNKWQAGVRINKVNHFQKRFDSEIEAALHVNWIIDFLGLTDRPKNIIQWKA